MTQAEREEAWQVRMREVQGSIAMSALFQVAVGFTGEQQTLSRQGTRRVGGVGGVLSITVCCFL